MLASISFALSLLALASAQSANVTESSVPYSNANTQYLTQTNSLGVITGMPAVVTSQPNQPAVVTSQPSQPAVVTTQPTLVTSQPTLATIPAGLPSGLNTITQYNTANQTTTFVVSVGNNSTAVVSGSATTASGTTASTASGSARSSSSTATRSGSASASSSSGSAGNNLKVASGALVGAGALFAAFL